MQASHGSECGDAHPVELILLSGDSSSCRRGAPCEFAVEIVLSAEQGGTLETRLQSRAGAQSVA